MTTLQQKVPLYVVPVASTSFLKGGYWDGSRTRSAIRFRYESENQEIREVGIEFSRAMVVEKLAESFCHVEHIEGCYDTLVEVTSSVWLLEKLKMRASNAEPNPPEWHHYMIYLDSVGCFQVLAASYNVTNLAIAEIEKLGQS
jgi:hypothetical protein